MWLLIAEMVLALGVIIFIMWWTMRARIDRPAPEEKPLEKTPKPIEKTGESTPPSEDKQA